MQSYDGFYRMYLSAQGWGLQLAWQVLGVNCWLNLNHNGLELVGNPLLGGAWAKGGNSISWCPSEVYCHKDSSLSDSPSNAAWQAPMAGRAPVSMECNWCIPISHDKRCSDRDARAHGCQDLVATTWFGCQSVFFAHKALFMIDK